MTHASVVVTVSEALRAELREHREPLQCSTNGTGSTVEGVACRALRRHASTRATCSLSFDETCAIVETGQLLSRKNGRTYRETRRILIAMAYARIRYGRTRNGAQRFRFYFRTSSQGERALDSRTGAHVSLEVVHAELSRLGLDADTITAHLASVCAPAHTGTRKAREIATPYYPPPSLTQFHGERARVKASDILEPIWRKRFAR